MSWFRVDDNFTMHPKVLKAGNAAVGVFVRLGAHCAQQLTDGFVTTEAAHAIAQRTPLLTALVTAGLLEVAPGGYQLHGYLERNPSRNQVESERAATRDRQRRFAEKTHETQRGKRQPNAVSNGVTNTAPSRPLPEEKNLSPNPSHRGVSDGSPLAPSEPESKTETSPPIPNGQTLPPTEAQREPPTASCTTREFLGTDPTEIAFVLGKVLPKLQHFPGGDRQVFREEVPKMRLSAADWELLANWFGAGGTRRHPSERVTWGWLMRNGAERLGECVAIARQWGEMGKPALDAKGEPVAPKIATVSPIRRPVEIDPFPPASIPNQCTVAEMDAIKAKHAARKAARLAAEAAAERAAQTEQEAHVGR